MGQYRWVMYSYILLHYHQYPQPQTFCLLHNMWILPLSYLVQLKYSSTISLYSLFFGILVLVECFQLWKLPLSLWNLTVWLLPKIKQGQQEGVWTIHTHTFTWSCLWWWNSVCTCRNATSSKSGKLQLLKAAEMENQDNVTMKTSLKLSCTSVLSYPPPHTHEASSPGDYYIISYITYKLIKLLQSFNMDRSSLVSLFKQMCPTEQIQTV